MPRWPIGHTQITLLDLIEKETHMTHSKIHRTLLLLTALVAAAPASTALGVGWNPATRVDVGARKNGGSGIRYYLRANGNDNKDGKSPANAWKTFNKAMDNVDVGCTLYVGAGTYNEKVEVKKSGTFDGGTNLNSILLYADVQGTFTGDAGPVIVRNSNEHGIKVDGRTGVEIDGFTFVRNGLPAADKKYYGLYGNNSSILIRNCEFAFWTNGVYTNDVSPAFTNCSFHDNRAWGVASERGSLTLTSCTVEASPSEKNSGRPMRFRFNSRCTRSSIN